MPFCFPISQLHHSLANMEFCPPIGENGIAVKIHMCFFMKEVFKCLRDIHLSSQIIFVHTQATTVI